MRCERAFRLQSSSRSLSEWTACVGRGRNPVSMGNDQPVSRSHCCVVNKYRWLMDKQFVDTAIAAMITPCPVVITVGFIGYLIAGLPGATVAALATFIPCHLFTMIPAPYFKKYGKLPGVLIFIDGIMTAVIGAIAVRCS